MKTYWFILLTFISLSVGLFLLLGRYDFFLTSAPPKKAIPLSMVSDSTDLTPEQVTENFYSWCFEHIGQPGSRQMGSPLTDKAYKSSDYLTDEFIRRIDEQLLASDEKAYYPFLCTQTIPQYVTVDKAVIMDEKANVIVHEIWNYGGISIQDVEVHLERNNGQWKIADISSNSNFD